ncbi:MAG: DNA mismatch repair endonuclease MutL [Nitrospirae bacterium]|nr:DNA mismatch repair endonuclease MutL [Nitrospirota bacterium]MBF0535590.1 DNA mismatch repair endonuclease MutL [Nitrospirota bacterium]MBF0617473.1 DNA mismatch repair endonuclease MutL [Nitrospirota bacterium]
MPVIELLDERVIDKIAAGEVIERPSSVVKELLENAIDACGEEIRVDILNGGKRLIRVSDDGTGMDRDDALTSLKRHATSKIRSEGDLLNLKTLGFRGEALSSIASVSRMNITTALRGAEVGTFVEIYGGEVKSVKEKASVGTTIEVRELFYNTPARKKFLKSTQSELYHIMDVVTQAALSYPERKFILYVDEKKVLEASAASGIRERIMQLYGMEFLDGLIEFKNNSYDANVSGFVSKEGNYARSRSHQYIFVNGRPIRDAYIRHAVYQPYKNILPEGMHPHCFLYMGVKPERVDFNVHPQKFEVRFSERETIYKAVLSAVYKAVIGKDMETDTKNPSSGKAYGDFQRQRESSAASGAQTYGSRFDEKLSNYDKGDRPKTSASDDSAYSDATRQPNTLQAEKNTGLPIAFEAGRRFLYLGDVYVAYVDGGGLCVADHHACHERVLYEKLRDGVGLIRQGILFPVQVQVPAREYVLLSNSLQALRDMAIDIEEFGSDTFIIRALPDGLKGADIAAILTDIASNLVDFSSGGSPVEETKEKIAKRIACHSSVRGKAVLNDSEMFNMLKDLDNCKDPYHCPHGRPTRVYLTLDKLKKLFKRT